MGEGTDDERGVALPGIARIVTMLLLALPWPAPAASPQADPRLAVRSTPELAELAREVEAQAPAALARAMRLVAPDGGSEDALLAEPIVVRLVAESSAEARSTPPWVAGFASGWGADYSIVLFPARAGGYPDRGLSTLLTHELAHVLVHRAARGNPVPRWFNEGLAMAAGGAGFGERARVALAVLGDSSPPLSRLDRTFAGGESEVGSAYALAGDIVRSLLDEHGEGAGASVLAGIGRGERFDDAFRSVTGRSVATFEREYWENRTLWDRWVPIVSSSVLLWGAISFLAVAAFQRRRARDRARLEAWGEEERLALEREPMRWPGESDS